ncbi:ABC transporter substrate-binding protein [Bifidobacterium platyrrhinorum]|uniref:ABC transporter substrate-binding protein n=1 Tax=Bifidobacterium platyrrhinorum TaxID=2661628 RepID=A0A6L9SRZ7_9BIFI|nr:ABC transporter substrate-binding protein [Bifidobacterium platyrrhinorum]NEG55294.1 ABC transporter substrate-binding protein [Bifidobacterium platyrrhinorum]
MRRNHRGGNGYGNHGDANGDGRAVRAARRGARSEAARWGVFLGVAALLTALLWAGWALIQHRDVVPGLGADGVKSGPAVTVGLTGAPDTLDIRTATGATSDALDRALIGNVYETLISRDDKNALTPGLASKWTTSADGKTLTLTLRSGLTFSNGHTLDSADVVASLQQAVEGKWPGADTKLKALSAVTNPNPTTVKIALSQPDATLTRTLSGRFGIVYDSEANIDYATKAVGSGPFTVSSFDAGKAIVLAARQGGDAKVGTATLKYYADDASLVQAAKSGDVDLALPDEAGDADALKDDASVTLTQGASTRKVTLLYNGDSDSILSDVQVRQSLRLLLDKQALTAGRADVAQVLGGPIGPLEPGYEDLTSVLAHDSAKAHSMLSYFGSGYIGTIKLIAPTRYQQLAQAIADQYNAEGLTVTVEALDDAQLAQRVQNRDFQLLLTDLDGTDGTAMFANAQSDARYTNADAQSQYAAAVAATNDAAYADGLRTYARTVSEDAASDWLYAKRNVVVASKSLSGYPTQMTDDFLPLANVAKR